MESPPSAIPDFYYALFAFYEPALTILGFIGVLCDPETVIPCPLSIYSPANISPVS
jgi:hypothetical protein